MTASGDLGVFDVSDLSALRALAARLAGVLRAGDVIGLRGRLGSGKTEFARAVIRHLCGAQTEVPSPTFNLVQIYDADRFQIWHFDLYRLNQAEEAYELGIDDAFAGAVSLIEWPERLAGLLPEDRLDVLLEVGARDDRRRLRLSGGGDWPARLQGLDLGG